MTWFKKAKQPKPDQAHETYIDGKRIMDGYSFHNGDRLIVRLTTEDGKVHYAVVDNGEVRPLESYEHP
jgi:hypothetical protein